MSRTLSRLKSVDFYRKLPTDFTEATLSGSILSIGAAVVMFLLFAMEFSAFLQVRTQTEMIVDQSSANELLRINFNISFPQLSCEFLTLDVSDNLGTKKLNLTKTIRKVPIDAQLNRQGFGMRDEPIQMPKYDDEEKQAQLAYEYEDVDIAQPVTAANFEQTMKRYQIVWVNFYAPWCPWCQRLEPSWEAATKEVHDAYPEADGRIRMAKVDCTTEATLCKQHQITGFPSMRIFRRGKDDVYTSGMHDHEAYHGDRSKDAIVAFAKTLVDSAENPKARLAGVKTLSNKSTGCNLAGFVLVKKVPGTLHFMAKSPGHSFDHDWMNLSHVVHTMYFGMKPSQRRQEQLSKLHPGKLDPQWLDKLAEQNYNSNQLQATFEHFLQVVMTTIKPMRRARRDESFDVFEYIVHSHTYNTDTIPSARFSFELSPIQISVEELPRQYYHFLTTTCAIIGGVFTVVGLFDGLAYNTYKMAKKVEIGKQT